jgi:hypothetical protein
MSFITDILDNFRAPKEGNAIIIKSANGDVMHTIKCSTKSEDNVFTRFYHDYSPVSGKMSNLDGCLLEIHSNVLINRQNKDRFKDTDNENSIPKKIYAPEALFLAHRVCNPHSKSLSLTKKNSQIEAAIYNHKQSDLPNIYNEYKKFLDSNGLKDKQRHVDFFIKVIEAQPDHNVIPEYARNDEVYRAASKNGIGLRTLPAEYLTFETFKNQSSPIEERFSRITDFNNVLREQRGTGISKSELLDIISHSKQFGCSLTAEQCLNALPEPIRNLINAQDIKEHLINSMKEFIHTRFQRGQDADMSIYGEPGWFEYYVNRDVPNPIHGYPNIQLTAKDWHELCSICTELISEGYVPKSVLDNPEFWTDYASLIGKGDYLANPDNEPYLPFDEANVFSHMPTALRNDEEVQKVLLNTGAVSISFFDGALAIDVWKSVPANEYSNIPHEIRQMDSFKNIGIQAVKANIHNITYLPSEFIEEWMIEKTLKEDMNLLTYIPENKITDVPDIEQKILDAIFNYRQQNIFQACDRPGEHGLVAVEQEQAKNMLGKIPLSLRTEAICKAAIQISNKNKKFIPKEILNRIDNLKPNENNKEYRLHR